MGQERYECGEKAWSRHDKGREPDIKALDCVPAKEVSQNQVAPLWGYFSYLGEGDKCIHFGTMSNPTLHTAYCMIGLPDNLNFTIFLLQFWERGCYL